MENKEYEIYLAKRNTMDMHFAFPKNNDWVINWLCNVLTENHVQFHLDDENTHGIYVNAVQFYHYVNDIDILKDPIIYNKKWVINDRYMKQCEALKKSVHLEYKAIQLFGEDD